MQEVTTPGGEEVIRKVPGRHRQHDIVSELLYVANATGGFDEVVTIVVETLERTR